jgi:hypothetical protein
VVRVARNIEIGFRFNLDGLRIRAAWYYADPEQIALFRAAVAAEESGRTLEGLVSSLAADGHEILGDVMKRIPRGYLADHPRVDLLSSRPASSNPSPCVTPGRSIALASDCAPYSSGSPRM